ncbi:MAG: hypothetical protein KAU20_05695 [Nanoarchaeota archaeon]|nr:hypothetical protein [Nanoarchaeota archaeon]
MGLEVTKCWTFYEGNSSLCYNPEFDRIDEDDINEYRKTHKFPIDLHYSFEDMFNDLTMSSGCYVLPIEVKEETVRYVKKLITDLLGW